MDNIIERKIILNGLETNYTVNTNGEIFSLNYNKTKEKRQLKQSPDKDGYMKVTLHVNNVRYTVSVARIVALTFIPNDDTIHKTQVNHKDGTKKYDNCISNLEWVTPQENIIHAYQNGLAKISHGEKCSNNKYDENTIHNICKEFVKNELTTKKIAEKLKVPWSLVQSILYFKTWKHISSQYDFSHYNKTNRVNKEQVEQICQCFEKGESINHISITMNIPFHIVKSIYYRQTWRTVSINYNF